MGRSVRCESPIGVYNRAGLEALAGRVLPGCGAPLLRRWATSCAWHVRDNLRFGCHALCGSWNGEPFPNRLRKPPLLLTSLRLS